MLRSTILAVVALAASPARSVASSGDTAPVHAAASAPIAPAILAIHVKGLTRTHEHVVRQELELASVVVGASFRADALAEGLQRLRNLLIFRTVDATTAVSANNEVTIEVRLTERWTVIPIFRFAGGGGTTYVILGTYDVNFLGRYLEVGGQYENLGGTHSGVAWIRKPRLLGTRWSVGLDVWKVTRPRELYDVEGDLRGGFTLQRQKLNSFLEREVRPWLRTGVGIELDVDRFDETALSEEAIALNQAPDGPALPVSARTVLGRTWLKLGRLDFDVYLVRGQTATVTGEVASGAWGSEATFVRGTFEGISAWRLGRTQNIVTRLVASASNVDAATNAQHLTYVGGLDAVRGFADGELAGRRAWYANVEYRISSFVSPWLVVQHDVFVDAGGTEHRPFVTSAGAGLRLLSPKVFRLTLRFDYAFTLVPGGNHGIAFGVQQFF
ncbi:MAG: BamA/TamA family outer membrane protein [Kofleriaceae bacterium]